MRSSHKTGDYPDLLAGALMIGLGGLGLWAARDLTFGTAARMGAGYLPDVTCGFLILIGAVVVGKALSKNLLTTGHWNVKPLLVLSIAVVGFAILAENFGFVISSAWLLVTASLADRESRWREVVTSTLILTVAGALVFVWGLGVKLSILPF
ncbi:tripartite tricarboxylate transporter TctB family protein [Phyllobacterium sp. SYP-B3895]|uniref:Tripartite tricarboxylate transporter TctB family protein n=1 Tax=Phyllobacterium pellucidum TaxID=2740464 RepID=A0A849VHU5_9HYPH|nr:MULTISPECIES: tripartite tricarboxylate transporter TctB family protein [Phyllobacterium]MRG55344.1 tripartite tricarboxylate transporter TctB family protein [Phyllobacterium sp. SYP-B3895]NTS29765.1 tripartite tricarboxylate transporter TctB family protein [Phyllobacterium pellucidum]